MTKTKTNTFRERLQRAAPETCDLCDLRFDQSDEGTWPDQHKYNNKYKYKDKDNNTDNDKDNPRNLWHLRHKITILTIENLHSWQSLLPDN